MIDVISVDDQADDVGYVGAPGSVQGNTFGTAKVLVVTQTREVHEEIADLLAKIREIAKTTRTRARPAAAGRFRRQRLAGPCADGRKRQCKPRFGEQNATSAGSRAKACGKAG